MAIKRYKYTTLLPFFSFEHSQQYILVPQKSKSLSFLTNSIISTVNSFPHIGQVVYTSSPYISTFYRQNFLHKTFFIPPYLIYNKNLSNS